MTVDHIKILADTATAFADGGGLRTGAEVAARNITTALSCTCAFIVRGRADGGVADLVAADGIGAADFRRLESRITKSKLWRIFQIASPIAIDDLGTEPDLKFLAFGTGSRFLVAVPIILKTRTVGFVAAGFTSHTRADETFTIKILAAFAPIVAQAMRVERYLSEQSRKLTEENTHLKQALREKYDFSHLVGNSSPIRLVYDQVKQVSRSNATVLLRGESGTGKEKIAGVIHYNSLRSKRPFIKVNCAASTESVIDNDLFGDERTGSKGAFEKADGGTLFLDEVSDLPVVVQTKLLRVIEEGEMERPLGAGAIRTNVRLITAATRDLEAAVAARTFNGELFYRLNAFTIFLPPLRERKADILLLAEHFLATFEREHKKNVRRISTPAIDMLTAYHFPGNVRELENAIERAVIVCDENVIHGHHLPPTLQTAEVSGTVTKVTLTSAVEAFERDLIIDTLKFTCGNIARAARLLDSTERILGYKIKGFGIDPKRFRK